MAPRARRAALAGLVGLVALLSGCVDTEREQYFVARQRVISADAGDASSIVSPVRSRQSVARVPEVWP